MAFVVMNRVWQAIATIGAPIIVTLLVLWWWQEPAPDPYTWLCWLHLPLLMFHEVEEYVFPGGFVRYMNTRSPMADMVPGDDLPLTEPFVLFGNMGIWLVIILGALLAEQAPWLAMGGVVIQILNVVSHPIMFPIKQPGYNPGLVTAVFVLIPYMTTMFWYAATHPVMGTGGFVLAIGTGVGFNALFVLSSRIVVMRAKRRS